MLRKQWFKHGDDAFVIKQQRKDPYRQQISDRYGLLPTPNGLVIVRPGDWICTNGAGVKSVQRGGGDHEYV
jgi:hypothetical protein